MCENPSFHNADLGAQEPRGCRHIHGDPGFGDWSYCQKPMVAGARLGDPLNPPYCTEHRALNGRPQLPYQWKPGKFDKRVGAGRPANAVDKDIVVCTPGLGDGPRLPVDLLIKFGKGFSHD